MRCGRLAPKLCDMSDPERVEYIQTVIVGGGQAGLAAGCQLQRQGMPFVILDASERIGDAWRNRWDSLRLFSPAEFNGLAGMRVPAPGGAFITKDETRCSYKMATCWWLEPEIRVRRSQWRSPAHIARMCQADRRVRSRSG
jgi:cation diffusion facilitator CzcD-associated flavoprotein CzcO